MVVRIVTILITISIMIQMLLPAVSRRFVLTLFNAACADVNGYDMYSALAAVYSAC